MHAFLMQDWLTVRGPSSSVTVTMSDADYMDMRPFQDVVFWVDVKSAISSGNKVSIAFQTAPAPEDGLFVRMCPDLDLTAVPATVQVIPALLGSTLVPVSRWLRWLVTSTSPNLWELTFRIWVSAGLSGR